MGEGGRGRRERKFLSFTSLPFSLPFFPFSPETPDTQAKLAVIAKHIKCTKLNPPITEVITITIATTTYSTKREIYQMDEFVTLDSVSASDINFPNFGHLKEYISFLRNCNGCD